MNTMRPFSRQDGFSSLGAFIGMSIIMIATILVVEAQHAYAIRQSVEIDLSRAANYSITKSILDDMRKDYLSALNEDTARLLFYDCLREDMSLDSTFAARDSGGREIYRLEIRNLEIIESPPKIIVDAEIVISPLYLNSITGMTIRIPVSCVSANVDMR